MSSFSYTDPETTTDVVKAVEKNEVPQEFPFGGTLGIIYPKNGSEKLGVFSPQGDQNPKP